MIHVYNVHHLLLDVNNANIQDKDNFQNYSPVIPVLYQVSSDDKDLEGLSDDHHNESNDKDPEGQSDDHHNESNDEDLEGKSHDKHNQSASDLFESSLQGK